jgi:hypothetical protein
MVAHLQFEGIRCFFTPQDAIIRPVTLLVGENSSGKTTFLALCQIASSLTRGFAQEFPFNEPPFLLGAYDQIASYRGGRAGRAKWFSITVSVDDGSQEASIRAEFVSRNGQPSLRVWRLTVGSLLMEAARDESQNTISVVFASSRARREISEVDQFFAMRLVSIPFGLMPMYPQLKDMTAVFSESDMEALDKAVGSIRAAFGRRTYAFAPIRTFPERTYNPVSAEPTPGGSHVPMLLAALSHSGTKGQWARVSSALEEFGSKSALFEEIKVIRKGKKESDPFQIGAKIGGLTFNLVDVGYGVSQALPILVDTLQRASANEVFLLQQPEVHLHPRAQAELGSFFARQAGRKSNFMIETHSDHLVDRIRMEVGRGQLRPEDVSLLYFERHEKHGATIHNLELAKDGSITNPPPGYRQFFLDEERSLLGV